MLAWPAQLVARCRCDVMSARAGALDIPLVEVHAASDSTHASAWVVCPASVLHRGCAGSLVCRSAGLPVMLAR